MKKNPVFSIACTELKMIFSTPVAWLMLIVFSVMCGLFFTDVFRIYVEGQEAGSSLTFVTEGLFCSDYLGLFPKVQAWLYLFIPLVSMGMLSKDLGSGTVKLLYSSPVSDTGIVLGKFLAMAGYCLAMMAVVAVFAVFGCAAIRNPDVPLVLTGMAGLFLLSCTYSAIGIFMSSLTRYQAVAALATFAVLAGLNYVRLLWQDISWVRDITWWLSISGRCEEFINGLICSEDVIYFITVSALFLALTVLGMSNRRKSRPAAMRAAGYAGVVLCAVAVGFISSNPHLMCFYDSTETKKRTLTRPSQDVMSRVKGPVVMTTYSNILDEEGFYLGVPSRYNSDKEYISQYLRFKPDIKIRYEYYWADSGSKSVKRRFPDLTDAERAERIADVYEMNIDRFQTPEEIARKIDLSGEGYRLVRQIRLKDGSTTFLRVFDDSQRLPQEKEITAAFKRLVDGPVKAGVVTGHGERDIYREADRDYYAFATSKFFRHSLINNGFDVVEVNPGEGIPDDLGILIIADPRTAYTGEELSAIRDYIQAGGNMLIAGEPGREDVLNSIVDGLGVRFDGARIAVPAGDFRQDLVLAGVTDTAVETMPSLDILKRHEYRITMPGATGIEVIPQEGIRADIMLVSDPEGWNELQTTDFENGEASCDSLSGERRGSRNLGVCLQREMPQTGKVQKILVLGDADCFSNAELMRDRYAVRSGNFSLLYEAFRWLTDGKYPVDTSRKGGSDTGFDMEIGSLPLTRWSLVFIMPFVMLVVSAVIIARRKSR